LSFETRKKIRSIPTIWDSLTLEEKESQLDWCPITDELIREAIKQGKEKRSNDIDEVVKQMSPSELASLVSRALKIHRERQKKKGKKKTKKQEEEEKAGDAKREEIRDKEEYTETVRVD